MLKTHIRIFNDGTFIVVDNDPDVVLVVEGESEVEVYEGRSSILDDYMGEVA